MEKETLQKVIRSTSSNVRFTTLLDVLLITFCGNRKLGGVGGGSVTTRGFTFDRSEQRRGGGGGGGVEEFGRREGFLISRNPRMVESIGALSCNGPSRPIRPN